MYNLASIAIGVLRRCAPGLKATLKASAESSVVFSVTLPDKTKWIDEEGFTETWHGTTLPFFFRIYHAPQKQLKPGPARPIGVYLFDNAHKDKAFGYAYCFPLLRTTWCRIIVQCAAHEPRVPEKRKDQLYSQLVYMVGVEIEVLRTEALVNAEWVIGVDDDGQILEVGPMSDDDQ